MAAVAAEDAVVVVVVSAPPPPEPTPCRLATALDFLLFASLWVASASAAALTVAGRASGTDSPVYQTLELTLVGAFLLLVLAVVAWCLHDLRLLKALVADTVVKNKKVPGASIRDKHTVVLLRNALVLFMLLQIVGLPMRVVPVEECHRIGAALFDLGTLGSSAICCFITVPFAALQIWKNKDWRSSIVISENIVFLNVGVLPGLAEPQRKTFKRRKRCTYRQGDTSTDYLLMTVADPGRQSLAEEKLL
ncbi:hypothetical protein EJB05_49072 [Eragrostis curvula]|uniref:Uncharacterized protein n=1 Tax=Eragrostis curvula TaxID=38414 RepID=A0A5J9T4J1_9POAL|nr:hypothetical protein EJB05_49072 [Eragrostis curvula]